MLQRSVHVWFISHHNIIKRILARRHGLGPLLTTPDVFSFMFFWLEPKEPKVQGKHQRSAGFAGPTHGKTLIIYMSFFYLQWKDEDSAAYYAEQREALLFR